MMDNPVNCWKPKSKDMAISSQASNEEGSETIREDGVHNKCCGSAGPLTKEEDIVRSPEKSEGSVANYKVYYLVSRSTKWYYIGITKNKLQTRLNQHKSCAKGGVKSPLYDCMRKYNDFIIVLKDDSLTHQECCEKEITLIEEARNLKHNILNLAKGGEGGFVVQDVEGWKKKLRSKRQGRKPALGMNHTDENKRLFSKVSKEYWAKQDTYCAEEILKYSFKEAKRKFGISKTHYYRLKRASGND